MPTILPLSVAHSMAVAALHQAYLPTPLSGAPGRQLLAAYYRALALGEGATGFVAMCNAEVSGYVCGVWAPARLRAAMLRTEWLQLGWWMPRCLLRRPQLLRDWLQRLVTSAPAPAATAVTGYELRPIVVAQAARGAGLAAALVERLVDDAGGRGYAVLYLMTEVDNRAARRFYEKNGFVQCGQLRRQRVDYMRYERRLGQGER